MSHPKTDSHTGKNDAAQPAKFQVSQKIVLYRPEDRKFLLVRNAFPENFFVQKYGPWDLIGGRIDEEEQDLEAALDREVREEAGSTLEYEVTDALGTVPMEYRSGGVLVCAFLAVWKGGEIILNAEHDEMRWESAAAVEESGEYHAWIKGFVREADRRLKESAYLDDARRIQADFDNYKRRQQESQKELSGYLIEKFLVELLPVMDNFRAATGHVPADQEGSPWVTGIQYIEKQLEKVLEEQGVSIVAVSEGDTFDPALHEAVSQEESASENEGADGEESGARTVVAKVIQNGYRIGNRVIRPAKVTVAG